MPSRRCVASTHPCRLWSQRIFGDFGASSATAATNNTTCVALDILRRLSARWGEKGCVGSQFRTRSKQISAELTLLSCIWDPQQFVGKCLNALRLLLSHLLGGIAGDFQNIAQSLFKHKNPILHLKKCLFLTSMSGADLTSCYKPTILRPSMSFPLMQTLGYRRAGSMPNRIKMHRNSPLVTCCLREEATAGPASALLLTCLTLANTNFEIYRPFTQGFRRP